MPSDGKYVSTWLIVAGNTKSVFTQIVVISVERGRILSDNFYRSSFETVTGIVVLNVSKGDVVFIRTHPTHVAGPVHSYPDQHLSFRGWKIV